MKILLALILVLASTFMITKVTEARAADNLAQITVTVDGSNNVFVDGCGFNAASSGYTIGAVRQGESTFAAAYSIFTTTGCTNPDISFGPLTSGTYDVFAVKGNRLYSTNIGHPVSNVVSIVIP